jgi:serine/threonine protein kinase
MQLIIIKYKLIIKNKTKIMNYCSKCSKIIRSIKYCDKCKKLFCSESCLNHHKYTFHLNEQYSKQCNDKLIIKNNNNDNYNNNKYLEISSNIVSPYLTKGTFTMGKIIYDQTYSLKNFTPVIENGKQKIIGSGSYGKVFLAKNKIDHKYYAIKHMKKKNLYKSLKSLKGIYNEIDIQSRINHPNIVKLFYVKENNDAFDLVMEYATFGNLFFYIKRKSYLLEEESFKYFMQVVKAVHFLHKNDLIHRDIKPENILMFEDNVVKLCDFGWCARLDGGQRITFCGTVEYMSPEMVNKEEYNKEIDVWSLGILLYEMIHGHSPFKPDKPKFNIYDVISNIKIQNLKFNEHISDDCKELIIHLLDRDISKRYKIADIYDSKFVKFYENKSRDKKNEKVLIKKELDNNNEYFKQIENNNNKINIIINNENANDKDIQKIKCKAKNNTARNFYPQQLIQNKENNENTNTNKYGGSHCKAKKTEKKFGNNIEISARYKSQENLNNYFKKPNVKEKEKKNNNKILSTTDLFSEYRNKGIKYQTARQKNESSGNIINQPLTYRNKKFNTQNVKNKQISQEIKNNNPINEIIQESSGINFFDNKKNYTNREKNYIKIRLNSQENIHDCRNKAKKTSKQFLNNNYIDIEENKSPLMTEIYENEININDINNFDKKKPSSKVKKKYILSEENNPEEVKFLNNYLNSRTGKRNTKVKNYYRINNCKINSLNDNPNYNSSSSPKINILNNYNNNIIKYSTFISNNKINTKIEEGNKNNISKIVMNKKLNSNNGKNKLPQTNIKRQNNFPIKLNTNKDNISSDQITKEDLDETPKKDIDNLKIVPLELLNNFTKELKDYIK